MHDEILEVRNLMAQAYRNRGQTPKDGRERLLVLSALRVGQMRGYSTGFADGMERAVEVARAAQRRKR